MLHFEEIADGIVDVALEVCAHGVAVAGMQQADARGIVVGMRDRRTADLPKMLAAGGFDQAVDGVVGVVGARLDALVAEVDRLLGVVADVGDVARSGRRCSSGFEAPVMTAARG